MDAFSVFGILGFIFGISALAKVSRLEKRLEGIQVPEEESTEIKRSE